MKTIFFRVTFVLLLGLAASAAHGQELYINEIFFDPPSSLDSTCEYIELRGMPNMSLANHYLIFLENENNQFNTGSTGVIDHIFNLGTYSVGTNGFLTLRQKGNPYAGVTGVAPGTTNLVNTSTGYFSGGWGSLPDSTIGASQEGYTGVLENSGFTAMLIRNNGGAQFAPALGQDMDQNNDGLDAIGADVNQWRSNWTILDSIGIISEFGEAYYGRLYGNINFGPDPSTNIEPVATYVSTGFEIEYIGRWGDSTGQTAADWHISNVTDKAASGYTGGGDYRQSGDPHPVGGVFDPNFRLESNYDVPYGTPLCRTLGATNYYAIAGDANQDKIVDVEDAALLASNWLADGARWSMGDFNGDGLVNDLDAGLLAANWHQSGPGTSVPEPGTFVLLSFVALAILGIRFRGYVQK